jgi:hypothetical protein
MAEYDGSTSTDKTLRVTISPSANTREGPGVKYRVADRLPLGATFQASQYNDTGIPRGRWYGNEDGSEWIHASCVEEVHEPKPAKRTRRVVEPVREPEVGGYYQPNLEYHVGDVDPEKENHEPEPY